MIVVQLALQLQVSIPKEAVRLPHDSEDQLVKRLEWAVVGALRKSAQAAGLAVTEVLVQGESVPTIATVVHD